MFSPSSAASSAAKFHFRSSFSRIEDFDEFIDNNFRSYQELMAAKDLFHNVVKQALLQDNWVITADPLKIKIEGIKFEIDLAAQKIIAAQKAEQKIAVEIKSFLSNSSITDFHGALGQFLNYRLALQMSESERILYLAVPLDTFESFFQEKFIKEAVKFYQLKLLIYNPAEEVITQWKN